MKYDVILKQTKKNTHIICNVIHNSLIFQFFNNWVRDCFKLQIELEKIDLEIESYIIQLSHVMRKPAFAICKQQGRRSAAQSDQHLCYLLL